MFVNGDDATEFFTLCEHMPWRLLGYLQWRNAPEKEAHKALRGRCLRRERDRVPHGKEPLLGAISKEKSYNIKNHQYVV